MASHDLDIPQITVVDTQDENNSGLLDNSSPPRVSSGSSIRHRRSPSDTHDFLPHPTLILTNDENHPASRASDASSSVPPPSPTHSAHSPARTAPAGSRDINSDDLSSLGFLAPLTPGHTLPVASFGTDHDVNGSSSLGLSLVGPCRRDVPMPLSGSDTSHPSSVASLFKRIIRVQEGDHADDRSDGAVTDSNVEPFALKPPQLAALVNPKSLENLERLGGIENLLDGLGTDRVRGLNTSKRLRRPGSPDLNAAVPSTASLGGAPGVDRSTFLNEATIEDRPRVYGHHNLPHRTSKRLLLSTWLALHGKVLFLLSIPALASLALGIFLTFSSSRTEGEPSVDWAEGIAIVIAILIVLIVGSLNNWHSREKQFRALNEKNGDRLVKVICDSGGRQIHAHEVVVGDVMLLERGLTIPCDGVFLSGHNVQCNESSATGEPDSIKKLSYEECIALRDKRLTELDPGGPSGDGELLRRADCFIVSGSKVLEGVGTYVVIAVGTKSLAFPCNSESTSLKLKLNDLADAITKIGSFAGGLLFVTLIIRYFFETRTSNLQSTPGEMGVAFISILNMAVTLVIVGLPKGLPLSITLALAFATKQMNKEDLFMRVLGSYETMANATVICTGKAGTLTQNEMTVVAGGANDGLALKTAQVEGFSGTEVAKGASDIILMDDSFSSIVGAIMWGRCINDSVRKSLQFLIAGSVTVVVTTFVWALASSSEGPVLSAIQLLWANLIMDTFAAVALATDPASAAQLQRKPDKTTDPLFTINMTKQILGQAFYQITIMLIFHFLGSQILGFHSTDDATLQKHHNVIVRTLVFNAFVFAQIFNSFNCRRLDRKLNVFEGTTKNWYFMAIIAFEVVVQVWICFFGSPTFDITHMGPREWVISLAFGWVPLPLGALIRLVPNEPCERAFKKLQLLPTPELLPTTRSDAGPGSLFAMDQVRGTSAEHRMHGSSSVSCALPDPDGARLVLAMVPSLEVSHAVASHCQPPCASGSHSNPSFDPPSVSAILPENGFEVHPDTPRDDPGYGFLGMTR